MTCSPRVVRRALRKLGLTRSGAGDGTGHERWVHPKKGTVSPALRKKDVSHCALYALCLVLEAKGIATRRHFWDEIKAVC
jgi:hypothetical protein